MSHQNKLMSLEIAETLEFEARTPYERFCSRNLVIALREVERLKALLAPFANAVCASIAQDYPNKESLPVTEIYPGIYQANETIEPKTGEIWNLKGEKSRKESECGESGAENRGVAHDIPSKRSVSGCKCLCHNSGILCNDCCAGSHNQAKT